jgi:muconolactone delta-isomerase
MQFLAVTRRRTDRFTEAEFAAVLDPEAEHARSLYARGEFRQIFSRGDIPGAVMIVEAPDLAEARRIMGGLPFARKEMMDVDVIPLSPYRGFVPKL